MPNAQIWLKLLQYAPMVLQVTKQMRGGGNASDEVKEELHDTREAMNDFKKNIMQRMDDLESENARLKTRIRDMESSFVVQKVLLYTGLGLGFFALVIALIAVITG